VKVHASDWVEPNADVTAHRE